MTYSKNALNIYRRLYYNGNESTPEEVHVRVAKAIGNTDEEIENFERLMNEGAFRPSSPILINAGVGGKNPWDNQFSACFVMDLQDSMESIIDMWSTCAKIFAGGSGAGIPITNLREEGSPIGDSSGTASGALRYLNVVQSVADTVKSGGRRRRAALLASAKYNHPQILEIVNAKKENKLSAFNISVLVDDRFMNCTSKDIVPLISPNKRKITGELYKKEIWDSIVENAWETGDPGLLFKDTTNKYNPLPSVTGEIVATNPCAEVGLPPWSVCCLASINLNNCLEKNEFSFDKLLNIVYWVTKFLDNVIDKSDYPHPKFKEMALKTRPIGIGLTGFADILYKLKIPYNSNKARELFSDICQTMTTAAIETSIEMCKKGKEPITIPKEDYYHFRDLLEHYLSSNTKELVLKAFDKYGIRNSTWTSIAPSGSIAISMDSSYAFEPHFALVYEKHLAESDEVMTFVNPIFELELDKFIDRKYKDGKISTRRHQRKLNILQRIKENKGSCQSITELPEEMRKIFVTAHDISPMDKLQMQAAGQRYISLGISSTCNLPCSATKEDVEKIFIKAWELGLKGITVYRDGCKENQPIQFGQSAKVAEVKWDDSELPFQPVKPKYERPIESTAKHFEYNTNYGKLHIEICKDDNDKIFQVLIRIGKQGSLTNMLLDSLSRCISKGLQEGVDLNVYAKTLRGNKELPFWIKLRKHDEKTTQVESIIDLIGMVFQIVSTESKGVQWEGPIEEQWKQPKPKQTLLDLCPNCNEFGLSYALGCKNGQCVLCGASQCS